jgi:protoheme IX farnesyltransferase
MLPAIASLQTTAGWIVVYTFTLWAVTLAFAAVAGMGAIYWVAAGALGGLFMLHSVRLYRDRSPSSAMRVFAYSITYVTLLFGAMAVDQLVRHV